MINILFWNINNNADIVGVLSELSIEHDLDMILLGEFRGNADMLADELSIITRRGYQRTRVPPKGIVALLRDNIIDAECRMGHNNTVIIGDFNFNPYETAMLGTNGINAAPHASIAQKEYRQFDGKKYELFYNPCWSLLGDNSKPEDTYYHATAHSVQPYWHVLDQVVMRPQMIRCFDSSSLRIIEKTSHHAFLNRKGLPDTRCYSDHLPICFSIMEDQL